MILELMIGGLATASTQPYLGEISLEQLTDLSDVIVVGRVTEVFEASYEPVVSAGRIESAALWQLGGVFEENATRPSELASASWTWKYASDMGTEGEAP